MGLRTSSWIYYWFILPCKAFTKWLGTPVAQVQFWRFAFMKPQKCENQYFEVKASTQKIPTHCNIISISFVCGTKWGWDIWTLKIMESYGQIIRARSGNTFWYIKRNLTRFKSSRFNWRSLVQTRLAQASTRPPGIHNHIDSKGWWKKSCTTWNLQKLVNNRIGMNCLPTGTGFPTMNNIVLDSSPGDLYKMTRHTPCQSTILGRTSMKPKTCWNQHFEAKTSTKKIEHQFFSFVRLASTDFNKETCQCFLVLWDWTGIDGNRISSHKDI